MTQSTKAGKGTTEAAGTVCWSSPSNIAIVKYWGKHGEQLPDNPSISLTLKHAYTQTRLDYSETERGRTVDFEFHGKRNDAFGKRLESYIARVAQDYPVLNNIALYISSENSFPHSTGIASSASAMSAMALCLASLAGVEEDEFMRRVSHLARLGSGSACRSVFAPVALWGKTDVVPASSDTYAVPVDVAPVFRTMCDAILIIDESPKAVSSSKGHALMRGHVYASARKAQARSHLEQLIEAMESGDLATFGEIAETEALSLHAMMMTSDPSYLLMKGATIEVIGAIREFRKDSGVPAYFTLDAGPNVHLLYPQAHATKVRSWIEDTILAYCAGQKVIYDQVGSGPVRVS